LVQTRGGARRVPLEGGGNARARISIGWRRRRRQEFLMAQVARWHSLQLAALLVRRKIYPSRGSAGFSDPRSTLFWRPRLAGKKKKIGSVGGSKTGGKDAHGGNASFSQSRNFTNSLETRTFLSRHPCCKCAALVLRAEIFPSAGSADF
jgi:hypothetical protein